MSGAADRSTLVAFLGIALLGGINGTAIKISNVELGPFWRATLRFGLASAIFFGLRHSPRPPTRGLK
jgi:drug/metabolite transporter (DMT)-like permease